MSARAHGTLVGRDREIALGEGYLAKMLAGWGSLVLIGGSAGVGKTALVRQLAAHGAAQELRVRLGGCYDLDATPPYGPWSEAGIVRLAGDESSAEHAAGDGYIVTSRGAANPRLLFDRIAAHITAQADAQPLLLALEDLHWADPASLELLRSVARQSQHHRLLIVATYRDDEIDPEHDLFHLLPALVREGRTHRINLNPLPADAVEGLVRARYELSGVDQRRLTDYLMRASDGNPLFLEEQLRALEEERRLRREGQRWVLDELAGFTLPTLIRQVLDRRLSHLDARERELLSVAAILGHDITVERWATVADVEPDVILELVQAGLQRRLLEESPQSTRVQFSHALIREALYNRLPPLERRRWHLQVAELQLQRETPDPEYVAHHLERGGDERAIRWLLASGERAFRRAARVTAAERTERAVRLMDEHGAPPAERAFALGRLAWLREYSDPAASLAWFDEALQLAVAAGDVRLQAGLLALRGELYSVSGALRAGLVDLKQSRELFGQVEAEPDPPAPSIRLDLATDDPILALALSESFAGNFREAARLLRECMDLDVLEPLPEHAHPADAILGALAVGVAELGRPDLSPPMIERARVALAASGDHLARAAAGLWALASIYGPFLTGRSAEQQRIAREAEEDVVKTGGAFGAWEPRLMSLDLLLRAGKWQEIERLAETAQPGRVGQIGRGYLAARLAEIALQRGELERVWEFVAEVLPAGTSSEPGDAFCISAGSLMRLAVFAALESGDAATAQEWLDLHERWLHWSGAISARAWNAVLCAAFAALHADTAAAAQHARLAIDIASTPPQPPVLLRAHRMLGELELQAGQLPNAAEHLREALRIAASIEDRYETARSQIALAKWQLATGQERTARATLAEARATIEDIGVPNVLSRIDQLIDEHDTPAATASELTVREVEVLRLVATGLTNAEVAAELSISAHTVGHHLRSIYAKLDVPSRAAATRYAIEHAIV